MNKYIKYGLIALVVGLLGAGSYALYLFNMPHRDIQGEDATFKMTSEQLVNEFIADAAASNLKYLNQVVVISGKVTEINADQLGQKVVLLKTEKAGFNCTFTKETNKNAEALKIGDQVKIKGVVNLGASYDEDLEEAVYGVLEKSDISK